VQPAHLSATHQDVLRDQQACNELLKLPFFFLLPVLQARVLLFMDQGVDVICLCGASLQLVGEQAGIKDNWGAWSTLHA
jgi:hypothetical protein